MLKIRRSWDRLIYNMGIPILVRRHLYIVTLVTWPASITCVSIAILCHNDNGIHKSMLNVWSVSIRQSRHDNSALIHTQIDQPFVIIKSHLHISVYDKFKKSPHRWNFDVHRFRNVPDNKFHRVNMGPTWVLSAPDGPHVGPMNLAIRGYSHASNSMG